MGPLVVADIEGSYRGLAGETSPASPITGAQWSGRESNPPRGERGEQQRGTLSTTSPPQILMRRKKIETLFDAALGRSLLCFLESFAVREAVAGVILRVGPLREMIPQGPSAPAHPLQPRHIFPVPPSSARALHMSHSSASFDAVKANYLALLRSEVKERHGVGLEAVDARPGLP